VLNKLVVASPVTQSREAVEQLIAYFNHGQQPEEMPSFYRLDGELVLVRSNKGDAYYVTTPKSCSCPASVYNPGKPCKHMTAYFKATSAEPLCDQVNSRAVREQFYASMRAAGAV
jgi:hypothetical protein